MCADLLTVQHQPERGLVLPVPLLSYTHITCTGPDIILPPHTCLCADLLAVQHTPEWPVAQLLLRRLVMALNTSKGLQVAIRCTCGCRYL